MTRLGRIPWFYPIQRNGRAEVLCTIPPEGVQFKDIVIESPTGDIPALFKSANGEVVRGWAEIVTITNPSINLAQHLRDRVTGVFPTLPVEPPYYSTPEVAS